MFLSSVSSPAYPKTNLVSFERFIDGVLRAPQKTRVLQDNAKYQLELDLPGVSKDQLHISIEGAVVRLKTTEQAKRSYNEAFELPEEIDPSTSTAKMEDGVLYLTLSKKVPATQATTLQVM
jgi:HSP20 family molecular chaperone IbpA